MSEHLDPPSFIEAWAALRELEMLGEMGTRNPNIRPTRWALATLRDVVGEYGALQEAKAMLVIQIEEMEREMPDD